MLVPAWRLGGGGVFSSPQFLLILCQILMDGVKFTMKLLTSISPMDIGSLYFWKVG